MDRPDELPDAPPGEPVTVTFEGRGLAAKAGEPLAVTLLAHGIDITSRSIKYHRPRGAFCLVGTCAQCWMRVDGVPNRAACTTPVRAGMRVERENAFPSAELDLFRAADLVFPGGLDHHRLGTTPVRAVNVLIGGAARQMAGLGSIAPEPPREPAPPTRRVECDLLVIGAGPAGLAAAEAGARAGLGVLLVEKRRELGGQLLTGLYDDDAELSALPESAARALDAHGGHAFLHTVALAVYREGAGREVLLRRYFGLPEEHLVTVRARTIVFATGGYEQAALFGDNDLPGHYGARALARLVLKRRVLPAKRLVVLEGATPVETAHRLASRLGALGVKVKRVAGYASEDGAILGGRKPQEAKGRARVSGLAIADAAGRVELLRTDLIASALPPAPAFELAAQAGATVDHRPDRGGFAVRADLGSGRATGDGVFAAGDVTGASSARRAMKDGALAGLSAALFFGPDAALEAAREAAFLR